MAPTSIPPSTSGPFGDHYDDDDNYDVSCGKLEIRRRVAIDICLQQDRSVWGILGGHKSGLLYLSLGFNPHPEYRLAWAEIDLEFGSGRKQGTDPIVVDFVPKKLYGEPHTINSSWNWTIAPTLAAAGIQASVGHIGGQQEGQQSSYWIFTAGKKTGPAGRRYTGVRWIWQDEQEHGGTAFDRPIASAIVLRHKSQPFHLAVSIEGKLRSRLRWWRRYRSPVATTSDGIPITPRDSTEDIQNPYRGLEAELLRVNKDYAAHGKLKSRLHRYVLTKLQ